jgi:hypothetical protein
VGPVTAPAGVQLAKVALPLLGNVNTISIDGGLVYEGRAAISSSPMTATRSGEQILLAGVSGGTRSPSVVLRRSRGSALSLRELHLSRGDLALDRRFLSPSGGPSALLALFDTPPSLSFALLCGPLALISGALALVGQILTFVRDPVALVRDPLALVGHPLPCRHRTRAFLDGMLTFRNGTRTLRGHPLMFLDGTVTLSDERVSLFARLSARLLVVPGDLLVRASRAATSCAGVARVIIELRAIGRHSRSNFGPLRIA